MSEVAVCYVLVAAESVAIAGLGIYVGRLEKRLVKSFASFQSPSVEVVKVKTETVTVEKSPEEKVAEYNKQFEAKPVEVPVQTVAEDGKDKSLPEASDYKAKPDSSSETGKEESVSLEEEFVRFCEGQS